MKRIYIVERKPATAVLPRLVDAASRQGALNYVASDTFEARIAKQHDIVQLMRKGVQVEVAGQAKQTDIEDVPDVGEQD